MGQRVPRGLPGRSGHRTVFVLAVPDPSTAGLTKDTMRRVCPESQVMAILVYQRPLHQILGGQPRNGRLAYSPVIDHDLVNYSTVALRWKRRMSCPAECAIFGVHIPDQYIRSIEEKCVQLTDVIESIVDAEGNWCSLFARDPSRWLFSISGREPGQPIQCMSRGVLPRFVHNDENNVGPRRRDEKLAIQSKGHRP